MNEDYKHYIRINADNQIIARFSDAFQQPEEGDICINEQGGYHFRFTPGGEENPILRNEDGVPLHKWDFSFIKLLFQIGQIHRSQVEDFAAKGWITAEEVEQITESA